MQHALHNHWFHVVIVILVVLDAFIVMFELLLDVGAFSKSNQTLHVDLQIHHSNIIFNFQFWAWEQAVSMLMVDDAL